MTAREEMAARWPTSVTLNLYQLSAVLAAVPASGPKRDKDLRAAMTKLGRAAERRRRAVERAGGRK